MACQINRVTLSGRAPHWLLIERLSGQQLVIPYLRTATDVAIVDKVYSKSLGLADHGGWGAHFGRELNASDDRPCFVERGRGLPVLSPVDRSYRSSSIPHLPSSAFLRRLPPSASIARKSFGRPRLAYRDVASATNCLTLIADDRPGWYQ